tara:strand:- start:5448 stop:5753 length:306 start_codon:yes stop_codon:yes gene_type:complete
MKVDEHWEVQNRLYLMKEKKKKLERIILNTQEDHLLLTEFSLFKKRTSETFLQYLFEIFFLFIFSLDKIVTFYYIKHRSFSLIKKVKKEIKQLTKEIRKYE